MPPIYKAGRTGVLRTPEPRALLQLAGRGAQVIEAHDRVLAAIEGWDDYGS
jgi:hypothetical protein